MQRNTETFEYFVAYKILDRACFDYYYTCISRIIVYDMTRRVLELFSGTGSVGNVAKKMGYDVVSLDVTFPSTHECDIMKWKYKMYPPGYFHVVWASPPCTEFSFAKTVGVRDFAGALRLVKRSLDIIAYFKPKWYVVENPVGYLRQMPIMKMRTDRKTVSYCKYGFKYRKNTDLWTNSRFFPKKCERDTICKNKQNIIFNEKMITMKT